MTRRFWLAALLGVSLACGGGGGGGGPTGPPPTSGFVRFTPDMQAAGKAIYMGGSGTSSFSLQVQAQEAEDLYGVSFAVEYPADLMSFTSASAGSFLSGEDTEFLVDEAEDGIVLVGLTRLGKVSGVEGNGVLATLSFNIGANGNGEIRFTRRLAVDSAGIPIDYNWIDGMIEIQR